MEYEEVVGSGVGSRPWIMYPVSKYDTRHTEIQYSHTNSMTYTSTLCTTSLDVNHACIHNMRYRVLGW